ncbi:MAG: nitroreductase family protein [Candidatus Cloacimonetes bacterium]|nr:nitroreductase family protein [Candidatus Cloacimonadota bacterium]MDD4223997.1 nitroreductase family protein [Candidatus Cloacimonadota bacterium]
MKPRPRYSHPIHEVIQKRWSPRAFADLPLSEEQALTLFEAARWAASCFNEQPWRFIWSLKDGSDKYQTLFGCLSERNQEWVGSASLLILALTKSTFSATGKANRWARHDLGLAIGNLTTQATLMDLYVHSMAGFSRKEATARFDLPEDLEPLTMIAVGWLGDPETLSDKDQQSEHQVQTRKDLADLFL